jgi:hypothetical protein
VAGGAADYRLVYSMHWPALDRRSRERGEEVARALGISPILPAALLATTGAAG